jgi:hypothetical protein
MLPLLEAVARGVAARVSIACGPAPALHLSVGP